MVTNFYILNQFTLRYNDPSTFVTSNQRELWWQWPVPIDGMEISVANAGIFNIDQNFIGAWLLNWDTVSCLVWWMQIRPHLESACIRWVLQSSQ